MSLSAVGYLGVVSFVGSWGNAPFAVAAGIGAVFALLQITGLLGVVAGGDHGGDAGADHDVDVDHDVDADADADAHEHGLQAVRGSPGDVGYHDVFARTPGGKAIAAAVMTVGPALSGAIFDGTAAEKAKADEEARAVQQAIVGKLGEILAELRARPAGG